MSLPVLAEVERVDRLVTAFIDEWTARTKRRHAVGDALTRLERICTGDGPADGPVSERLEALTGWLNRYGEAVVDRGVRRGELEVLVRAAEHWVHVRETRGASLDVETRRRLNGLVDRLVELIRRGTAELGLEYTPAGLVETPDAVRRESARARRSLLERLQGFEDVKAAYKRALEFQQERLDYFYQEDSHLLSVLDYQLRNLEARPNADDEFFAACLLYYLSQHNYRVAPYLERFRRIVEPHEALSAWEAAAP